MGRPGFRARLLAKFLCFPSYEHQRAVWSSVRGNRSCLTGAGSRSFFVSGHLPQKAEHRGPSQAWFSSARLSAVAPQPRGFLLKHPVEEGGRAPKAVCEAWVFSAGSRKLGSAELLWRKHVWQVVATQLNCFKERAVWEVGRGALSNPSPQPLASRRPLAHLSLHWGALEAGAGEEGPRRVCVRGLGSCPCRRVRNPCGRPSWGFNSTCAASVYATRTRVLGLIFRGQSDDRTVRRVPLISSDPPGCSLVCLRLHTCA